MVKLIWLAFAFWLSYPLISFGDSAVDSGFDRRSGSAFASDDEDQVSTLRLADGDQETEVYADASPAQIYSAVALDDSSSLEIRPQRMRAEFEHQSALLVSGGLAASAPDVLAELARTVAAHVSLVMLVNDDDELQAAMRLFAVRGVTHSGSYLNVPHNTIWARDYGPMILSSSTKSIVVDAAYSELDRNCDDAIPSVLAGLSMMDARHTSLSIPGGNLLSNGRGVCITTTRIQEENASRTQQEIADGIADTFGATTVAILEPLQGESTGHVDMFATFTDPRTVVVGAYDPFMDPENAAILDRNAARLASIRTGSKPLRVVRIPMPTRRNEFWPTFTNVVYANGRLLVPSYESTTERQKIQIRRLYSSLLPSWEVHFIRADELIRSGGALHCVVSNLGTLRAPHVLDLHATSDSQYARPRPRLASSKL